MMAMDPYLESIRENPEYRAMVDEIDNAVSTMQQNVMQAEANGGWNDLRSVVEGG